MKEVYFTIKGMTCSACSSGIERSLKRKNGVEAIEVNLVGESARVEYNEKAIGLEEIFAHIVKMGYEPNNQKSKKIGWIERIDRKILNEKRRVIFALALSFVILYLSMSEMFFESFAANAIFSIKLNATLQLLITLVVMHLGRKFYIRGFGALVHSSPNMDTLVALGSGSAFLYSFYIYIRIILENTSLPLYFESTCVILAFILLGKYLENYAKTKSVEQLDLLLNFYQKTTLKLDDSGSFVEVLVKDVKEGDLLKILPGETIPVDGIIESGEGNIEESMINGESLPLYKKQGDKVFAGTIMLDQWCEIRTIKDSQHSTIAEVLKLVRKAQDTKAPISRLADRASGYFVPLVMSIAILALVFWWVYKQDFNFALEIFVSILVVSCPCALGLATPMAILIASTQGIKNALLFKNAKVLENAHKIQKIIFDKTGTLTEGKMSIVEVRVYDKDITERELLEIVGSLEQRSKHPIAKAIAKYIKENGIATKTPSICENVSGSGVFGTLDGRDYKIGKMDFFQEKVEIIDKTSVFIGEIKDGKERILGALILEDVIKPEAKKMVYTLKNQGFELVILSGDNEKVVKDIANQLGIKEFFGNLKPHQKYEMIENLKRGGARVMMVGDGLNDAPALALADVSLAMGEGSDLSKDRADIVVLNNDIYGVVDAIELSSKTFLNIKQNLFWAFFYNIIAISIASGLLYHWNVILNPMVAAFAMCLSSLSVILNAQRLRLIKFRK